jgi:hypothetical protein
MQLAPWLRWEIHRSNKETKAYEDLRRDNVLWEEELGRMLIPCAALTERLAFFQSIHSISSNLLSVCAPWLQSEATFPPFLRTQSGEESRVESMYVQG